MASCPAPSSDSLHVNLVWESHWFLVFFIFLTFSFSVGLLWKLSLRFYSTIRGIGGICDINGPSSPGICSLVERMTFNFSKLKSHMPGPVSVWRAKGEKEGTPNKKEAALFSTISGNVFIITRFVCVPYAVNALSWSGLASWFVCLESRDTGVRFIKSKKKTS